MGGCEASPVRREVVMDDKPKKRRGPRKPKVEKPKVSTHMDEQVEAALVDSVARFKRYCSEGIIVALTDEGKYKIVTFGEGEVNEHFEGVLASCIKVALMALAEGPGGAKQFDA